MDKLTKYRLTGAAIWLGLLIFILPSWFESPVEEVIADLDMSQTAVLEDDLLLDQEILERQLTTPTQSPVISSAEKDTSEIKSSTPTPGTRKQIPLPEKPNKPEKLESLNKPLEKLPAETADSTKNPAVQDVNLARTRWYVQVATLSSQDRANLILHQLEDEYQVTIRDFSNNNVKSYAVRLGPFYSEDLAEQELNKLSSRYSDSFIIQNP